MIFDEVGSLLDKKDFNTAGKHLNENLMNVKISNKLKSLITLIRLIKNIKKLNF